MARGRKCCYSENGGHDSAFHARDDRTPAPVCLESIAGLAAPRRSKPLYVTLVANRDEVAFDDLAEGDGVLVERAAAGVPPSRARTGCRSAPAPPRRSRP